MRHPTSRFPNPESRFSNPIPDRYYLMGALVLTLAVRLYLFKNYYTINNDGIIYIQTARYFLEGDAVRGLGSYYPPIFPLLIAAVYPLTGEWELAGQFWPFVLGVFMIFPLFGLLCRFYGRKIALAAIFFYGVSPYLARLSLHVRSEIPYIFFLLLALYFLQKAIDRADFFPLFLAGITSALAYLVRSEGIGLVVVGALYLLYRGWVQGGLKRRWLQLGPLFLGFVLFSAPYVLYLKWDTGTWLISRKGGLILSLALADYDPSVERVSMKDSDKTSSLGLIAARPILYGKKVFIDAFRSPVVYFEALHYSYLPFLFLGCFLCFRRGFWEREDFLFFVLIAFYLGAFALLYVNRRFAVPLVPFSLGWVGAGYLAFNEYAYKWWGKRGVLITAVVVALFLVVTLPKTLKAIGLEKLYLRQAGLYLRGISGNPKILTDNGRVAFYAGGENHVLVKDPRRLGNLPPGGDGDFLALEREHFEPMESQLVGQGWIVEEEFTGGPGNSVVVLSRRG